MTQLMSVVITAFLVASLGSGLIASGLADQVSCHVSGAISTVTSREAAQCEPLPTGALPAAATTTPRPTPFPRPLPQPRQQSGALRFTATDPDTCDWSSCTTANLTDYHCVNDTTRATTVLCRTTMSGNNEVQICEPLLDAAGHRTGQGSCTASDNDGRAILTNTIFQNDCVPVSGRHQATACFNASGDAYQCSKDKVDNWHVCTSRTFESDQVDCSPSRVQTTVTPPPPPTGGSQVRCHLADADRTELVCIVFSGPVTTNVVNQPQHCTKAHPVATVVPAVPTGDACAAVDPAGLGIAGKLVATAVVDGMSAATYGCLVDLDRFDQPTTCVLTGGGGGEPPEDKLPATTCGDDADEASAYRTLIDQLFGRFPTVPGTSAPHLVVAGPGDHVAGITLTAEHFAPSGVAHLGVEGAPGIVVVSPGTLPTAAAGADISGIVSLDLLNQVNPALAAWVEAGTTGSAPSTEFLSTLTGVVTGTPLQVGTSTQQAWAVMLTTAFQDGTLLAALGTPPAQGATDAEAAGALLNTLSDSTMNAHPEWSNDELLVWSDAYIRLVAALARP